MDLAGEYEALIQFLYLAPVGLAQTSLDGEIVMINPLSAQLLMPLSRDGELTNLFDALESVAPDLRNRVSTFCQPHGMVCDALRIQIGPDARGKFQPQMLSLSLLKLDQDRLMAVLSDITRQVAQARLLRQSDAWLNAILTGVTDYALVRLDKQGCVGEWNPSIGRITGFGSDETLGRPFSVFYPDGATTPDRVLDRLREADESGWSLDEGWRVKADGSRFWGSAMISPLRERADQTSPQTELADSYTAPDDPDAPAYCLILRDITDKREASESQRKATFCDHLTGLANRRTFFEAAELEVTRGKHTPRQLSLILFDADHFKSVNDTHGHPAGDAVLRHFAAQLTAIFREVDVVARVGGEEFAVLLPSTGLQGAMAVAERLRLAVASQPVDVGGVPIPFTVSAGVATTDNQFMGVDVLMKRADVALYAAKAGGRNRIECWSSALDDRDTASRTHRVD